MMKRTLALCGLGIGIMFGMWACNGAPNWLGGSAVAAFMPDSVSLDVNELPDEDSGLSARTKDDAAEGITTPFERTLRAAARIMHNFHRMADRSLALGARIRYDMTSPDQTQVSGTFTVQGQPVLYKADFAAFDVDGDGTPDGSGNAVDTPVAIRIWTDRGAGYGRFLCALVTVKPSGANLGAGRMFVRPDAVDANAEDDLQVYANWDRTDSAHKWNEAYITGRLLETLALSNGHQRVDVRTNAEEEIEKTVRSASNFTESPYGLNAYQASVHFKPGSGAALLSGLATGTGGSINFTDICVNLIDQSLATNGECDAFDVQDMAFIDFPTGSETAFPAAFPEQPTF
jgi:hypothetical protein